MLQIGASQVLSVRCKRSTAVAATISDTMLKNAAIAEARPIKLQQRLKPSRRSMTTAPNAKRQHYQCKTYAAVFCAYMSRGIGAMCEWLEKGGTMALDTNTFLIVLAAAVIVMGFVVWAMFKKVS